MIRFIVKTTDMRPAVYGGGEVERTVKTLDLDLPELESLLSMTEEEREAGGGYVQKTFDYEIR